MRVVSSRLPLLGLMLGDYTGIEPEQCARVLSDGRLHDAARLLVVGDAGVLQQGARDVGIELAWHRCAAPETVDWSRPDQGQIATKLQGFNRGVTLTGGLKTVFTIPAHGTAFDIVGTGRASTGALEQAVRLAARVAVTRQQSARASASV